MQQVTIELSESTLSSLEEIAKAEHDGNRNAAVQDLLDTWLHRHRYRRY